MLRSQVRLHFRVHMSMYLDRLTTAAADWQVVRSDCYSCIRTKLIRGKVGVHSAKRFKLDLLSSRSGLSRRSFCSPTLLDLWLCRLDSGKPKLDGARLVLLSVSCNANNIRNYVGGSYNACNCTLILCISLYYSSKKMWTLTFTFLGLLYSKLNI